MGIKPLALTPFWHRRICEATILVASCIIIFFVWAYFTDIRYIAKDFFNATLIASLAGVTIAIAAVSYLWTSEKYKTIVTYAAYILLIVTTGLLVVNTGGTTSPFIALWMVTAIFAGIFGNATIIGLFIIVNVYALWLLFDSTLTKNSIQTIIMAGELPIIISYILWHSKTHNDKSKDRAYYDLANELNQVSNKAEVVINAIGDGVIAVDNQGVIELINPAAQRIVGWGKQDAIGLDYKSVLQLLKKDGHELDKTTDPVFEVLTTNQQKRVKDLFLQTNSGKRISVAVVASPTGHMGSGAIVVFRDITKEAAEEHEQTEFISTASHEMRTPVAAIEGYLGLALNPQTATIDEKAHDFITKAHEAAQHLGRLFQDLLDVSKADDGRLSNNPKVINVVEFTQEIIEELKPKATAKDLRIFFKALTSDGAESAGLATISPVFYTHLDADHLREVLSNLIENAVKYTPKGQVVVDINGDTSHVVVSVSDSGIGIPAEDIPHLFQKFYRVDNTDTREIGGTGLGLYLCRKLIEAMNGRIWVESEYKHGSTFFIEVPRITHEEANRLIEASIEDTTIAENRSYAATDVGALAAERSTSTSNHAIILNRTTQPAPAPAPAP
ncbi:PAS domain-containing protein, partial [Candidatus Saccharibacteria bacterium]|nr:PAS domain-containing protein [Candidatus Saccharibacteria bacterium]